MMQQVIAVIGACAPERHSYARQIADEHWAQLMPARHMERDGLVADDMLRRSWQWMESDTVVLEYPLQNPALHIIGEWADITTAGQLTEMICVVDAIHLLRDLTSSEHVQLAGDDHDDAVYASWAELVVSQIEYASTVVLVNTENMGAFDLNRILALISHLAPNAHLELGAYSKYRRPRPQQTYFTAEQSGAGWMALLNGEFTPQFKDPSVVALRYEQLRPFHPERLDLLMRQLLRNQDNGVLLRSVGFCHLATRGHITAQWDHVGSRLTLSTAAYDHQYEAEDEPLAFGQDLGLIGINLAPEKITAAFDAAALTDQELVAGPLTWSTFNDPFPEWSTVGG